jgi:hypothetical protein
MARTGTVHRLRIDLSDVDRGVYEALDLRVAQHPSEPVRRVLLKTIAYALVHADGIAFSRGGLSDTEEPEIAIRDEMGIATWVEIGSPAADRLKRATNAARSVVVFCAGDVDGVLEQGSRHGARRRSRVRRRARGARGSGVGSSRARPQRRPPLRDVRRRHDRFSARDDRSRRDLRARRWDAASDA